MKQNDFSKLVLLLQLEDDNFLTEENYDVDNEYINLEFEAIALESKEIIDLIVKHKPDEVKLDLNIYSCNVLELLEALSYTKNFEIGNFLIISEKQYMKFDIKDIK
ncbi:MAG: hypothetical protein M0R46_10090 [Candidatus Muirbacterium halophilum]|nr:hypothetical protein [Candidatus Muirbacterium halophilum]